MNAHGMIQLFPRRDSSTTAKVKIWQKGGKGKKERLTDWALGHEYMEASPHYSQKGFRFTFLPHILLVGSVVKPSR